MHIATTTKLHTEMGFKVMKDTFNESQPRMHKTTNQLTKFHENGHSFFGSHHTFYYLLLNVCYSKWCIFTGQIFFCSYFITTSIQMVNVCSLFLLAHTQTHKMATKIYFILIFFYNMNLWAAFFWANKFSFIISIKLKNYFKIFEVKKTSSKWSAIQLL